MISVLASNNLQKFIITALLSTAFIQSSKAAPSECAPMDLSLQRQSNMSIIARAYAQRMNKGECIIDTSQSIQISSSRGKVSKTSQNDEGIFTAVIKPDALKTGEYVITASAGKLSTRQTAIVFDQVHSRWGQPVKVPGLVNSTGWEDSPFITPNGDYLFIMYLPISASCLLEQNEHKASCFNKSGPIDETHRPGLSGKFGKNRFKNNKAIVQSCVAVGDVYTEELFKTYSVIVPPMISYGFKRQADGSFGKPFPITIEGVDACVSPSGLDVYIDDKGQATAVMGLVDPASWNTETKDDYPALYTATITLDKPNSIAIWNNKNKKLQPNNNHFQLLFGEVMKHRQDNPHAVVNPQSNRVEAVFWDSEHHDEDIFYRLLEPQGVFPDGPWGPVKKTPVFSSYFKKEIQPFFDGEVLSVSSGRHIASRDFKGKNFKAIAKSKSWGKERIELAISEGLKGNEKGPLHGVGDPTYATVNGKKQLYFVYLKRNDDGLLDFNIGFVEEQ